MAADFRYFLALLRVNAKATMAQRGAYLIRGLLSVVTHSVYIIIWFVFFTAIPSLGGWQLEHILLAYGISVVSWGILSTFAFGFRTLPDQIDYGELDVYLTQPRPVLLNVAMGSSKATGLGEILFGLAMIFYSATLTAIPLLPVIMMLVCACFVFGGIALLTASLAFWIQGFRGTTEEMIFNFNILASRPGPAFTGWMKIMLVTIIPVSFMTHVPIDYVLGHRIEAMMFTLAGTILTVLAGFGLFSLGLRRYESGNRFGVRG